MERVRVGDRLAIFPYANCPAFENITDRAEIRVKQLTLRGYYTRTEREQIWGRHRDGSQKGINCKLCPRCAAEKLLQDRIQPEPGQAQWELREILNFVDRFGLA